MIHRSPLVEVSPERSTGSRLPALLALAAFIAPIVAAIAMEAVFGKGREIAAGSGVALLALRSKTRVRAQSFFALLCVEILFFLCEYGLVLEPTHGGLYMQSDPGVYDAIARRIASDAGVWEQLNPFRFQYVYDAAWRTGWVIPMPGFYKVLGVTYSIAESLYFDGAMLSVCLNMLAMAYVASTVYDVTRSLGARRIYAGCLSILFLLLPASRLVGFALRKDPLILALLALAIRALLARSYGLALTAAVLLIPFRTSFAFAVGVWAIADVVFRRWIHSSTRSLLAAAVPAWLGLQYFLPDALAASIANPDSDIYDELRGSSVGWTAALLHSGVGRVLYAISFPFPSASSGGTAPLNFMALTAALALTVLTMWRIAKRARNDHIRTLAIGWLLFITIMCLLVRSAVDASMLGIIEPRYKLPALMLSFILAGTLRVRLRHQEPLIPPAECA